MLIKCDIIFISHFILLVMCISSMFSIRFYENYLNSPFSKLIRLIKIYVFNTAVFEFKICSLECQFSRLLDSNVNLVDI